MLRYAYLHGANLRDADFAGANLKKADLTKAKYNNNTSFPFLFLLYRYRRHGMEKVAD